MAGQGVLRQRRGRSVPARSRQSGADGRARLSLSARFQRQVLRLPESPRSCDRQVADGTVERAIAPLVREEEIMFTTRKLFTAVVLLAVASGLPAQTPPP